MGLGLYIGSRLAPGGSPPRTPRRKDVFGRIATAVREAVDDPLAARLIGSGEEDGRLFVRLYPSEEPVEFAIAEGGYLVCSAKTSSAGPGYHAMLVELLEKIETPCGLTWDWDNEAREFQDETGFHAARDYRALQTEMAVWLRSLARVVLEEADVREIGISLPEDCRVAGGYFAISALGYWTREWFEKVAAAEPDELLAWGAEFFPWWKKEADAVFWRNCGMVQCWVDVPWRPPVNEEEEAQCRVVLDCFERARRLDPLLRLPEAEIAELQRLLDAEDAPPAPPAADLIGFRRRVMRRPLAGGWTVDLPGYYYEDTEEDGGTQVFWFGDRTVRASTFTIRKEDGSPASVEQLLADVAESTGGEGEPFSSADRGCQGRATLARHEDEEGGPGYWMLQGAMVRPGHICVLTVCYEDPADKPWAIDTWKSTFRPPEEDEDEQ